MGSCVGGPGECVCFAEPSSSPGAASSSSAGGCMPGRERIDDWSPASEREFSRESASSGGFNDLPQWVPRDTSWLPKLVGKR